MVMYCNAACKKKHRHKHKKKQCERRVEELFKQPPSSQLEIVQSVSYDCHILERVVNIRHAVEKLYAVDAVNEVLRSTYHCHLLRQKKRQQKRKRNEQKLVMLVSCYEREYIIKILFMHTIMVMVQKLARRRHCIILSQLL